MSNFYKICMLSAGLVVVLGAGGAMAQEPVRLDNLNSGPSRLIPPIDDDVMNPPQPRRSTWQVQQVEGRPGVCTLTRQSASGTVMVLTAEQRTLTFLRVTSPTIKLPTTVSTVPITLAFDTDERPLMTAAEVSPPSTLSMRIPHPARAYDSFERAMRLSMTIDDGVQFRSIPLDLAGLRTAMQDVHKCQGARAASPMPPTVRQAVPPPLQPRTPQAIIDQLGDDVPVRLDQPSAAIPPLEWPEGDLSPTAPVSKAANLTPNNSAVAGASSSSVAPATPVLPRPALTVMSTQPAPTPGPKASPRAFHTVDTFRARKDESLRDVLRRWSDRAGVDLVWTLPHDPRLVADFSFIGDYRTAVARLLAAVPGTGVKTTFADQGVPFQQQPFVDEARAPMAAPVPQPGPALSDFAPTPAPAPLMQPVLDQVPTSVAVPTSAPPPPPTVVVDAPMMQDLAMAPSDVMPMPAPPPSPPSIPLRAPVADTGPVRLSNDPNVPVTLPAPAVPEPDPSQPTEPLLPMVNAAPPVVATAPAPAPTVGPVKRWRALSGASMRQVLQAWGEEAGVPVIWQAPADFAVRYSINQQSDFARAVADLLNQYGFEALRPVGQVYRDPATAQVALVIRIQQVR